MGVQARAYGAAADAKISKRLGVLPDVLAELPQRYAIRGEFLAQAHRHSVLKMRAAALENFVELAAFAAKSRFELLERRIKFFQKEQGSQPHSGGEGVISRLAEIDVVIGVNDRVIAKFIIT